MSYTCFDFLTGTHGNYQVAKSEISSMRYVTKDGNYVAHGVDPKVFLQAANQKSSTKLALVVQDIQAGKSLRELNDSYPTVLFMHKPKVESYMNFVNLLKLESSKLVWPTTEDAVLKLLLPMDLPSAYDLGIATWLEANIKRDRPLGTKQL